MVTTSKPLQVHSLVPRIHQTSQWYAHICARSSNTHANTAKADRLVGFSMLVAATVVFVYYTVWTLFMPFVDDDHILHSLFLPRVWAIRIPVILLILGTTVVGSFLSVVMIKSNRKKALKAQQKKAS
ncbi:Dolichol phosphate-mannose biosynthesis regulatory protein [Exserohilum turcicum]